MISGVEPRRNVTTGVPHAIASAIARPNGSSIRIGASSALAAAITGSRSSASSPRYCTVSPCSGLCKTSARNRCCSATSFSGTSSIRGRPITFSGTPAARATDTAMSRPLSGTSSPTKQQ